MAKYETPDEAQMKLDLKYGKIAKKRLLAIGKAVNTNIKLIDMDDDKFKEFVSHLKNLQEEHNKLLKHRNNNQNINKQKQNNNQNNGTNK